MTEEIKIEAHGRVQGVNFRNMAKGFCERLAIKGYVMNRDNGSLFLIAQGDKEKLRELLKWIQENPGFAKIEELNYKWKIPEVEYKEFSIVRERNYISDKMKSVINLGKRIRNTKDKIPVHIVVIPDGNRRWAKEKGLIESMGHYKGGSYNNLEELFREAKNLGVKYFSIWGFSTENWKRDEREKKAIFDLILGGIERFRRDVHKNKIRFRHIGRKDRLPKELVDRMGKLEEETKNYREFNVQLFLDYGGRDEINRMIKRLIENGIKEINDEKILENLDTNGIPDPDLIIRTSGEQRTSGMMPFQSVYAELYFTDIYFPDFDVKELKKAVEEFGRRQRRIGK